MAKINKILLNSYRNFERKEFTFNNKCNVFYGDNGSGKTNILESLSILVKGRGFRNDQLANIINDKYDNFEIYADVEKDHNIYNIKVVTELIDNKYKKITSVNDEKSPETKNFLENNLTFIYFLPEFERLFITAEFKIHLLNPL